jgi:hypothetical protein
VSGQPDDRDSLVAAAVRLRAEVGRRIVGQRGALDEILIAMLAGGHALLVGVPGLAKTLMIRSVAEAFDLDFRRIQFTPDLVPSDITGTEILEEDTATGSRSFRFVRGPVFANIVLADEINRAPPRTQAALLEAMQEHRVTAAGETMALPEPFFVLATQNPSNRKGPTRSRKHSSIDSCSISGLVTRASRTRWRSFDRRPATSPSRSKRSWMDVRRSRSSDWCGMSPARSRRCATPRRLHARRDPMIRQRRHSSGATSAGARVPGPARPWCLAPRRMRCCRDAFTWLRMTFAVSGHPSCAIECSPTSPPKAKA